MPAEWAPHEATWIAWPHNREDWPGRFAPIPWVYGEVVRKLSGVEKVRILVQDAALEEQARRVLRKVGARMEAVEFFECPTDRVWTRDYCPLFVRAGSRYEQPVSKRGGIAKHGSAAVATAKRGGAGGVTNGAATIGEVAATSWRFNGWAKYDNWAQDAAVPAFIAQRLGLRAWKPEMVLEGGSIDVNGSGLVLTTEECLLSDVQARNPGVSRREIERRLSDYLGVDRVIWLRNGIAGDDTHGHVDDLARFTDPETVVAAAEEDRSDANYEALRENYRLLLDAGLKVVKLPMPRPLTFAGRRLPASYANFYVANGLVLVPTFNDPADRVALETLARRFPNREVVGIHCVELIWGFGALHCMTQQQPA